MKKNKNLTSLDAFKNKHVGKRGTDARRQWDSGYKNFRIGALVRETRIEKGLTQEQLAEKCGTTKAYISKIENDVKEIKVSTLQKIVEIGFGGKLEFIIQL